MRLRAAIILSSLLLALSLPSAGAKPNDYVDGEVLVTFKQGIQADGAKTALGKHSLQLTEHYAWISWKQQRVSGFVRAKGRHTAELIAELQADPSVASVEPNYLRYVSVTVPSDPDFSKLWALQNTGQTVNGITGTSGVDTQFLAAWKLASPSSAEVVVGVVDTGLDITHPDIAANVWTNPGEIAGNAFDDDGNGYTDDVHGYDFADGTATMTDSGYHGTHVAGTIAAVGKNSIGMLGVEYRAKILPLKVSSDGNIISASAEIAAFYYAIALKQRGVNIVALNASFGGPSSSTSEQTAITALRDVGIILCAAAGNESANNDITPSYPANYPVSNIISVAALDQNNNLASFSNYGATTVHLAAPGVNIYSTEPVSQVTPNTNVTVGTSTFAAVEIQYSGTTNSSGLTKTIYNCGLGNPADFPSGVNGNIALIQRGTLTFAAKVTNAMNAGAVAAIVYDNTTGALNSGSWTLGNSGAWIPALRVTMADGQSILARLTTTGTVLDWHNPALAYQFLDGTSMATPHVSGAVAFAALNFPSETMSQRIARILNHVTPVSALAGKMTSGGRLNLLHMVDTDGDGLPDWWELQYFGNLAQGPNDDPDGDGFTNLAEYLSGTSPTKPASHLDIAAVSVSADSFGNHFVVSFPSLPDRTYQVESSDTLQSNSWSVLGSPVAGTGATIQVVDPSVMSAVPMRFYRLDVPTQ